MEKEKKREWIKIGLMFTIVLCVISGALSLISIPYVKIEIFLVFVCACSFWHVFLLLYIGEAVRESRLKKR